MAQHQRICKLIVIFCLFTGPSCFGTDKCETGMCVFHLETAMVKELIIASFGVTVLTSRATFPELRVNIYTSPNCGFHHLMLKRKRLLASG